MNTFEKAKILGDGGKYDTCGPKACEVKVKSGLGGIYHAKAENQNCKLLKTLMSNSCTYDCKYCPNAKNSSKTKATYEPQELANLFQHLVKTVGLHGLFLSSGVTNDPDKITEKMLETVEIIRYKQRFKGYIHFKVLPGVNYDLVKRAAKLSNRLSINIEASNTQHLNEISTNKDFKSDIIKRQYWLKTLKKSQSTQMIVGAADETDLDILKTTNWEYKEMKLNRVYYSAFKPVQGTELQNKKQIELNRQNRLYNVDFMLRDYKFQFKEFKSIMDNGMLPRGDPKIHLAHQYFDSPLDLNEADFKDIIRVPGIGPKTADKIINLQKTQQLSTRSQLKDAGIMLNRAEPFLKVNGYTQKRLLEFN